MPLVARSTSISRRGARKYIDSIAGTLDVDTAAECAKVVPLNHSGRLTYWYAGPTQASTQIDHKIYGEFWAAFAKTYPNIKVEAQNLGYNDMLNKARTAALGNAAPMVARFPIMWGVEFAAKGQLHQLAPEDVGHKTSEFWPGAMKSVTWKDKTYGVPDQQRDGRADLERRNLQGSWARSRCSARHLGRSGGLFRSDQGKDRQVSAMVWSPG